jgi:hypothetical protein
MFCSNLNGICCFKKFVAADNIVLDLHLLIITISFTFLALSGFGFRSEDGIVWSNLRRTRTTFPRRFLSCCLGAVSELHTSFDECPTSSLKHQLPPYLILNRNRSELRFSVSFKNVPSHEIDRLCLLCGKFHDMNTLRGTRTVACQGLES